MHSKAAGYLKPHGVNTKYLTVEVAVHEQEHTIKKKKKKKRRK